MTQFETIFEKTVKEAENLLNGTGNEEEFILSIQTVIGEIRKCTDAQIKELPYDEAVQRGIRTDRELMKTAVRDKADQASLVATLAAYKYSRDCRLEDHSGKYMGWVSELRSVLDRYYKTKTQNFC